MFNHYFEHISGIEIFSIISMMLFFLVFVYMLIRIIYLKKSYIIKMQEMPLESNNNKNYEK